MFVFESLHTWGRRVGQVQEPTCGTHLFVQGAEGEVVLGVERGGDVEVPLQLRDQQALQAVDALEGELWVVRVRGDVEDDGCVALYTECRPSTPGGWRVVGVGD